VVGGPAPPAIDDKRPSMTPPIDAATMRRRTIAVLTEIMAKSKEKASKNRSHAIRRALRNTLRGVIVTYLGYGSDPRRCSGFGAKEGGSPAIVNRCLCPTAGPYRVRRELEIHAKYTDFV